MAVAFIDDDNNNGRKDIKKTTKNTIKFTDEEKIELRQKYMPRHSHTGFIVAIILLILLTIGGPIGMFFYAKGVGWNEAVERIGQEYYDAGYNTGYDIGYDGGYSLGFNNGQYWGGFRSTWR